MSKNTPTLWTLQISPDQQELFIRHIRLRDTSEVAAATVRLLFMMQDKPNTVLLHIVQAQNRIDISLLQQDIDSGMQKQINEIFE